MTKVLSLGRFGSSEGLRVLPKVIHLVGGKAKFKPGSWFHKFLLFAQCLVMVSRTAIFKTWVAYCWEGAALGAMSRLLRGLCFLVAQSVNNLWRDLSHNVRDLGSVPGSGRFPGEGNGSPLQYSCLKNSMDRGAWLLQSMGSQRVRHDWVTNTMLTGEIGDFM